MAEGLALHPGPRHGSPMGTARALGPRVSARLAWFCATAVLGSGCDLQTKAWAEGVLAHQPGHSMMLVSPWLELELAYNRGTAFSFVRDLGDTRLLFGVFALLAVLALAVVAQRLRADRGTTLALGAIAAGAIGNGIDRMFRVAPGGGTGVIDFIKLNYPWGGSWPTFNVADVLVAIAAAYLVLYRRPRRRRTAA
jgi:signal peptidase II